MDYCFCLKEWIFVFVDNSVFDNNVLCSVKGIGSRLSRSPSAFWWFTFFSGSRLVGFVVFFLRSIAASGILLLDLGFGCLAIVARKS
ncbi:transmembrane protein, putative [Medicago truncatula]|uniref:Transmembrane protein, putative n=1 Tax=Medicago truncatula TaxID=3880 RepID=A0A072UL28_MEDTR|nr:transmembrane protein, putative [Medicago truncatula]